MDVKLGLGLATGMFYHAPAGTALPGGTLVSGNGRFFCGCIESFFKRTFFCDFDVSYMGKMDAVCKRINHKNTPVLISFVRNMHFHHVYDNNVYLEAPVVLVLPAD